jgi:hypothetical protein
MDDKKIAFVPFHAINQFMMDDFRHEVIRTVFNGLNQLDGGKRGAYQALIRSVVKIPGFRNSINAPTLVKLKGANSAFEKSPIFVAQTISCWADLHGELRQRVYDLLVNRGWEIMPMEADRAKLPGFLPEWHPTDHYDVINQAFNELYPDDGSSENEVRLMTVWLSDRLPYDAKEDEEESGKASA